MFSFTSLGDIILATTPREIESGKSLLKGAGRTGDQFRWTRAEISYVIEPIVPNKDRVTAAQALAEQNTNSLEPVLYYWTLSFSLHSSYNSKVI